jgi:hypothetical protein
VRRHHGVACNRYIVVSMNSTPAQRTVKIAKSLLDDAEIAAIFQHQIGVQIYLSIGSSHLRSQFFNASILRVVRYLVKRKTLPKTVLELQRVFSLYGRGDPAAREPWRFSFEPESRDDPNWNGAQDRNNKRLAERNAKFQELLDALKGINPWRPDWIPGGGQ